MLRVDRPRKTSGANRPNRRLPWSLPKKNRLSAFHFSLIDSLRTAQHVLEMFRRSVEETSPRRLLDRLANRLVKIVTEAKKLNTPEK